MRTLYTMVNEGAKILEEGIAQRASDIDVSGTTAMVGPVIGAAQCSGQTTWVSKQSSTPSANMKIALAQTPPSHPSRKTSK